jgi:hypothetical protein
MVLLQQWLAALLVVLAHEPHRQEPRVCTLCSGVFGMAGMHEPLMGRSIAAT